MVWWSWVGAVPVCPPVSPHKGASIIQPPRTMRMFLPWKRRYADVRAGTQAPPLRILLERIARGCSPLRSRLGRLRMERLILLGRIVCKWLFCLCGIAWKNITERGRSGAYVPVRVAPQGRIRRSLPAYNACIFWYGNAATRTFGRTRRHRPYGFVWVDDA